MTPRDRLDFRKSSYSGNNGGCVELAAAGGRTMAIRDSKDTTGPILYVTDHDLRHVLRAAKNGELDR